MKSNTKLSKQDIVKLSQKLSKVPDDYFDNAPAS